MNDKKTRHRIIRWDTGAVLWEGEADSVRDALHMAFATRADLTGANRMLSLTAEQKTFDLDKLLLLPVPVFKAFVRRLAVVAGLAVVEPDARLEAVSEAMAALTRVIDTLAADSTLPARSSGQLKAGLE